MRTWIQKFNQLAGDRAMQAAYARWVAARAWSGRPPMLDLVHNVRIGGWIKFSEYWSFQNCLPGAERSFVRRRLGARPNEAVAFDIGANIGVFTCFLGALGAGQVHSFEPIPETFCRLKANVMANGLTGCSVLNCLAVGQRPELVTFQVQADSPATNQLDVAGARNRSTPAVHLQHVAATSLDAYCESFGVERIDFLKVDVEGMEPRVLAGGARMLSQRRVGAILIEVCPRNLSDVGSSPAELHRQIVESGYRAHFLTSSGEPGRELTLVELQQMSLENIVLLPG